jgi:threonine 3-dehydrogenase
MTAFVTGGAGFIGAALVRALLDRGERRPVVFDIDPSPGRLDGVKDRVEFAQGDLGDVDQVLDVVRSTRPDTIYHLGGMLSAPSDADPAAALRTNALGTFHVLEAARQFDTPRVLFSSSIATYSMDIRDAVVGDQTIQRPELFYGATKLFCEHMGLFYRRKYGIDFRGLRYPSIVGPGVRTASVSQYTSGMIEASAKGNPYTVFVSPETRNPIMYYKEAARAMLELRDAPAEDIRTVNYILAGVSPAPSAGEIADAVRDRVPGARIRFEPDREIQAILDRRRSLYRIDDGSAQREWGWSSEYNLAQVVDEVLKELGLDP